MKNIFIRFWMKGASKPNSCEMRYSKRDALRPAQNIATNKYVFWAITFSCFFSFIFRLYYIDSQPYWLDESYTVWFAAQSYSSLFFWVPTFESHPPLYYATVKLWNETAGIFFENPERYFSLILSILLILVTYKIWKQISTKIKIENNIDSIPIILFLSFSSLISWYSIEARPYLLFVLAYSVILYGFFCVVDKKNHNNVKSWLILSLGALLTNWSHSTGPIHSFVIYATLLINHFGDKKSENLKYLIYSVLVVFTFSIPLLYIIFQQLQGWATGSWISEPSLFLLLKITNFLYLPHNSLDFLLGLVNGHVFKSLVLPIYLLIPILFGYGIYLMTKQKNIYLFYLILFSFLAPIIYYLTSLFGPNILLGRVLIPVVIPYYLFLAVTIAQIKNMKIVLIILGLLFIQLFYDSYEKFEYKQKEPWDKIYAYLSTQSKDSLILIFPNALIHPLSKAGEFDTDCLNIKSLPHEYPAINKSTFYPGGTPSVPGFTTGDVKSFKQLINDNYSKIILVARGESLYDPNGIIHDEFANSNFKLKSVHEFFKNLKVYEYTY